MKRCNFQLYLYKFFYKIMNRFQRTTYLIGLCKINNISYYLNDFLRLLFFTLFHCVFLTQLWLQVSFSRFPHSFDHITRFCFVPQLCCMQYLSNVTWNEFFENWSHLYIASIAKFLPSLLRIYFIKSKSKLSGIY